MTLPEPHLRLLRQEVARAVRRSGGTVDPGDLLTAAWLGLVSALERHGGAPRDERFEIYVRLRVRGAILDQLRALDTLPRGLRAELRAAGRGTPHIQVDALEHVLLDETESPLARLEAADDAAHLPTLLAELPAREAWLLRRHYLEGVEQQDLARELGISAPRASQLTTRALRTLRARAA